MGFDGIEMGIYNQQYRFQSINPLVINHGPLGNPPNSMQENPQAYIE